MGLSMVLGGRGWVDGCSDGREALTRKSEEREQGRG